MSLAELAEVVDGDLHADSPQQVVRGAAFVDSRKPVPGGLFVAIEGERVDGHAYAVQALEAGASAVLCRRAVAGPCVVVSDPVAAMGRLAHHVVTRVNGLTVVGITGSQGKTGVKDIVAQLLERRGETVATTGSFNNEVGLPLTVLNVSETTRFLVAEMGARGQGHIRYLTSIAQPSVGVVLNVGSAHLGEFGGKPEIAAAKAELVESLPQDGFAVLNADDELVSAMSERTEARIVSFGVADDADVGVSDVRLDDRGAAHFTLGAEDQSADVALHLVGEHQALNAAAAAAVALNLGLSFEQVVEALHNVVPRSPWRMELHHTRAGLTVVNDAYNANPDSVRAALETLERLGRANPDGRTIAVLGEMLELGDSSGEEHEEVGRLAVQLGISRLVVVGEGAMSLHLAASNDRAGDNPSVWVPDAKAAIDHLAGVVARGDVVLVKASRAAGLEEVAEALLDETEASA